MSLVSFAFQALVEMAKLLFLIVFLSSFVKFEKVLGVDDVDDKKKQEEKRKNQVGLELCAHTLTPCATCSAILALDRYLLYARK